MRTLFTFAFILMLTPAVAAAPASEAEPGCEPGQAWIGYARTDPARAAYDAQGAPGGLAACEGEHWDGQDPLADGARSCAPGLRSDPSALHASMCLGSDPNAAPGENMIEPVGLRASTHGSEAAYAAANVALVGRVALYADESTLALYYRDNTIGNMVPTILGSPSITGPPHYEADCEQATYEASVRDSDRWRCARDNTAVTIEHALLS